MPSDERKQAKSLQHPTASQLTVYSEGKGTDSFRAAVAKHLKNCLTCASLVDSKYGLEERSDTNVESVKLNTSDTPEAIDQPVELIEHPQYAIEREIGRGGMGIVYLVKHKLTGRQEALKVLMPSLVEREDIRIRFLREIQSAASLDHPHICRTLNAFIDGKVLGLVMEYLPGSDLALYVKKHGPIPVRSACSLAIQLCAGLQHAHEKGMIHRDIKPGNLMVDKSTKGLRLRILDFGLARGMMDDSPEQKALTVDGRILGTPEFMSPEQALTPSNVDIRSDLYSVGCVLYFMLSGSAPFQGETVLSILQSHISKQATPLTAINRDIPQGLWAVVSSLLEKDRTLRPSSPADVVRMLTPFVKFSVSASPESPAQEIETKPPIASSDARKAESSVNDFRFTPRPHMRKRKQSIAIAKLIPIFLPTLVILGVGFFFKEPIQNAWREFTEPRTSKIILKNIPLDYEIFIDGQKTNFARSNANAPAEVTALPGTYKLTLKKYGETKSEQTVTVIAGRNIEITVATNDSPPKPDPTVPAPFDVPDTGHDDKRDPDPWATQPEEKEVPPTAEEIQVAIASAKEALRNRDSKGAKAALAVMFNDRSKLRLQESQPEASIVLQLDKFADTMSAFNENLASSIRKRLPNESVYIGQVRHTFLGSTEGEISLQRNNETVQLKTTELPVEIEQCLLDLELDYEPQYSGLVKAVGLLSHPKKTRGDLELARKWIQTAIQANFIPDQFETLVNDFAIDVSEDTDVRPRLSSFSLQRRLAGADGEVEKLFLLPPNFPLPKQTTLLASVLSKSFRGSAAAPFWNIDSGEVGQHNPIKSPLWACEVSANGKWMVTFGETSPQTNLRIYALPLANPIFQLSDLDDQRSAISLSSDSRSLAACSADEMFIRWNLSTKAPPSKVVSKAPIGRENLTVVAIRPNNMELVAAAAKDGSIRIWRTADGSESSISKDVNDAVRAMKFNRKGDRLIVVRENGMVELRDLSLGLLETFRAHSAPLTALSFSTKGRFLVTADQYNNVRLWDTDELKIATAFSVGDSSKITAVTTDAEGDLVAIGHLDSSIELWSKK